MKVINQRYHIQKKIKEGEIGITYIVEDKKSGINEPQAKILKLYNTDKYGRESFDVFKQDYLYLKQIDLPCAIKAFDFSLIYSINGKEFTGEYYYYTVEQTEGKPLTEYRFNNKKEKVTLFNQIKCNLNLLHRNKFHHGNLNEENIIISKGGKIFFRGVESNGSIEEDKNNFNRILKKYSIEPDTSCAELISFNEKLESLRERWHPSISLNRILKLRVENILESSLEEEESIFLNFRYFRAKYYKILIDFIEAKFSTGGYRTFYLKLNGNSFSLIKEIHKEIKNLPEFHSILEKYEDIFLVISEGEELGTSIDRSRVESFILDFFKDISFKYRICIILDNFSRADSKSQRAISSLLNNHSGEKMTIICNRIPNGLRESKNFIDRKININPTKKEFCGGNLNKMKDIFYPVNIDSLITKMNNEGYCDIIRAIDNFINILKNRKEIKPDDLNLTEIIEKDYYYLDYYMQKEHKDLLAYLTILKEPVGEKFLKELLGEKYTDFKNDLFEANIIINRGSNKIAFFNSAQAEHTGKMLTEEKKEYLIGKKEKIIQTYRDHFKELEVEEKITLLKLYYQTGRFQEMGDLLLSEFINDRTKSRFRLKSSLGKMLEEIKKEKGGFNFPENNNISAILKMGHSIFYYVRNPEEKESILREILKMDIDKDVKFSVYFTLYNIYEFQNKIKESSKIIDSVEKFKSSFDIKQKLNYLNMKLHDRYHNQKHEEMREIITETFKLIKGETEKYKIIYMDSLLMLSKYYYNLEQFDRYRNSLRLLQNRAEAFQSNQFQYAAHTNSGVFYFYEGNQERAEKHFNEAYKFARKDSNLKDMITANLNLGVILEDKPEEQKSKFLQAYKYSKLMQSPSHLFLIIHNLADDVLKPEEIYNLIIENENLILEEYEYDEKLFRLYLFLMSSIFEIFVFLDRQDELKKYFTHLKNIEVDRFDAGLRSLNNFLLILHEILIDGFKDSTFSKWKKNLGTVKQRVFMLFINLSLKWIPAHLNEEETGEFIESIYNEYREREIQDTLPALGVMYDLIRYEGKETEKGINHIKSNLEEYIEPDYLRNSIYLRYGKLLKEQNLDDYEKLLSVVIKHYREESEKFKNKEYINYYYLSKIEREFRTRFSVEYKKYFSGESSFTCKTEKPGKFLRDIFLVEGEKDTEYVPEFLHRALKFLNFDRAALFERKGGEIEKIFHTIQYPFLYRFPEKYFYADLIGKLDNKIINKKPEKKNIDSVIIIPIIDRVKYKRFRYHVENLDNPSRVKRDFILAFLYFDKVNRTTCEIQEEMLYSIQAYFTEYWLRKLQEKSYMRDSLTDLFLKDVFMQKFREHIHGENYNYDKLAITMLDIDDFKDVNDTYGHKKGDEVLSEVGRIVKNSIRPSDIAGRYGGEEFIVLLTNVTKEQAEMVAERIRKKIKKRKVLGELRELTVSIGVSCYPKDSEWIEELIKIADERLYRAKDLGKNSVVAG